MKQITFALATVIGATSVWSEDIKANDTLRRANNHVGVAVGTEYQNYREIEDGGTLDSEKGYVKPAYRIYASSQFDLAGIKDVYTAASFSYTGGKTRYDGGTVNQETGEVMPLSNKTKAQLADWSVRIGKAIPVGAAGSVQLIPFVEYGQHRWDRDLAAEDGGYLEHYRNKAISLGVLGQYAPTDRWVLSAEVKAGRYYSGKLRVVDVPVTAPDGEQGLLSDTLLLGSRPMVLLGLKADYAVTSHFHLTAGYSWQRFQYGRSNTNEFGLHEPRSISQMQRLELGAALSF
jgi:hypothetical protein